MLSHSASPVNPNRSSAGSSSASLKFLATGRNGLMFAAEMSLLASFMIKCSKRAGKKSTRKEKIFEPALS